MTIQQVPHYFNESQTLGLEIVVIASCSASILGTIFIVGTYTIWSDLQSVLRKLLVYLSICDFVTASGNLVGIFFRQEGLPCTIQSFITTLSSMASFMWTVAIALHLFLIISKRVKYFRFVLLIFHVVCWGTPLIIVIIATCANALGWDQFSGTVGWCWITSQNNIQWPWPNRYSSQLFWKIVAGKGLEITSYILTPFIYILSKKSLEYEKHFNKHMLTHAQFEVLEEADKKLILVPVVFVFVRIWGTIRFILSEMYPSYGAIYPLAILQGMGDCAQGWANCIIFCFFNRKIQQKLCYLCNRKSLLEEYEQIQ